jgi:hypothetical protein
MVATSSVPHNDFEEVFVATNCTASIAMFPSVPALLTITRPGTASFVNT